MKTNVLFLLAEIILGHSLSWYDTSVHHLIHHSSIVAPGCNIYHSDIVVITANVWIPEMLSSPNSHRITTSPTIPISVSAPIHHSDESDNDEDDEENVNTNGLNSNHLQQIPTQWNMSINGNDFLPVYNHHQQQQQTTIYEDDHVWYERLRSMATLNGSEQQSSSDSSSNDIQQHHQLFDVYSQHLPPPMMASVSMDPHMNYYSTNHVFDHYHHHHIPEYQTMFSF